MSYISIDVYVCVSIITWIRFFFFSKQQQNFFPLSFTTFTFPLSLKTKLKIKTK